MNCYGFLYGNSYGARVFHTSHLHFSKQNKTNKQKQNQKNSHRSKPTTQTLQTFFLVPLRGMFPIVARSDFEARISIQQANAILKSLWKKYK